MSDPTANAQLRDVVPDDLPVFFEHQSDLDAARLAAFPPRDQQSFMAHWRRTLDDDTVLAKAILVDGQVAGNIVSFIYTGQRREVGYWLGRKFWGRSIATRALELFLELEITRPLYAFAAQHNAASIRVLEKCGFRLVGPGDEVEGAGGEQVRLMLMELPSGAEEIPR